MKDGHIRVLCKQLGHEGDLDDRAHIDRAQKVKDRVIDPA